MDQVKAGELIRRLRNEKGLTQKQLADMLNVSDKAVSKWERGSGFPDVSLLRGLSNILDVNVEKILDGQLDRSSMQGGNMKNIKFYVCPECGNIITATGNADVSCCGRKLNALVLQESDDEHSLKIEDMDDEYYITFDHEMTKEHYLNFVAWVGIERIMIVQLYPEQGSELRMPKFRGGRFYYGCSQHGLFFAANK